MSQILIVSNDCARLANMLDVLNTAGHRAAGATTFEEATRLLARRPPDVVIADERLGAFNGLHLIVRARAERPGVGAIVTTPAKDRGLEADARRLNIACIVKPQNPAEWLAAISRALPAKRRKSSSNRHAEPANRANTEMASNLH
jgi:DNA-binding NtrC family response regulator